MDLYPAIDLRGAHVVRLAQGDFTQETIYGDDPVAVAREYETAGVPWIHVVDLDAVRGTGHNRGAIADIARSVHTPIQCGGGVRDADEADALFELGVRRVVLGTAAVEHPELVRELSARYPGRIAVGLDHRNGELRVRGWVESSGAQLPDLLARATDDGVAAVVVTDIARDGARVGPDFEGLRAVVQATTVPVIASGGVGSLDDLKALGDIGVTGVIVGRALYEGVFTVEEAMACVRRA
jgi:phosphoribosylformimino-5-aminoimidazole carboxamide ribotide isomerase